MPILLLSLNAVVSLGSAGAALLELLRPGSLLGEAPMPGSSIFYGRLYAARAIPVTMTAGFLPFVAPGLATAALLFASAVSQAADALLGLSRRKLPMIIAPSVAAVVHALCAYAIL